MKTKDPEYVAFLEQAKKGEIVGDEVSDIDGELNDEGSQKQMHHFKAQKIYVRGTSKLKKVVPDIEAKDLIRVWKEEAAAKEAAIVAEKPKIVIKK